MKAKIATVQSLENVLGPGPVLSIYLNVDQSYAPNRLRGFETVLNDQLRDIESRLTSQAELTEFRMSWEVALRALREQQPGSGTMILFAQADGRIHARQLEVPIETAVRWQNHPYVQPILAAEDEFKPLLAVLSDHQRSRFFTSVLGHLTEHSEIENPYPSKHTKAAGKNRVKSQTVFNRKSDERLSHHLKSVAGTVEAISQAQSIGRLILMGNEDTSKELYDLLPTGLRRQVVGFVPIPIHSGILELRDAIAKVGYRAERQAEIQKVDSLLQLAGPHSRGVAGIQETLDALAGGRLRELVYSEGLILTGSRCGTCNVVFTDRAVCPVCQASLNPVDDVVEFAIEGALRSGATVEQVRGDAANKLRNAGGIGGFLRYEL